MEASAWAEIFKGALSLGFGGLLMALGLWWFQRSNVALGMKLDSEQLARIRLLEEQYKICDTDRTEIKKQALADRATMEARIADLNARIIEIYKSRQDQRIADQMTRAAEVVKAGPQGAPKTEPVPS